MSRTVPDVQQSVFFRTDHGYLKLVRTGRGWSCPAFAVEDEYQRQGHGTALMAAACEWADQHGYVLSSKSFMNTTFKILERFGFVEDDESEAHWRKPHPPTIHDYISTSCLHGDHEHCRSAVNAAGGEKTPGTCKHCKAVCRCPDCDHERSAVG